jgi:acyl-CoA synthetase (AMP-forming)/AMP-acid ligase II
VVVQPYPVALLALSIIVHGDGHPLSPSGLQQTGDPPLSSLRKSITTPFAELQAMQIGLAHILIHGKQDLKALVKARLSAFKVPKEFLVVEELPKNPAGKILKRELREKFVGGNG